MTLTLETRLQKFKQQSGIKAAEIFVVYTEIGQTQTSSLLPGR